MEQTNKQVIKARMVAKQTDGAYEIYVFQDTLTPKSFVMCARCPNWNGPEPQMMQEGFLNFKEVQAGKDTYYDNIDGCFRAYQYDAIYFLSFVPITHVLRNGFVVEEGKLTVG